MYRNNSQRPAPRQRKALDRHPVRQQRMVEKLGALKRRRSGVGIRQQGGGAVAPGPFKVRRPM